MWLARVTFPPGSAPRPFISSLLSIPNLSVGLGYAIYCRTYAFTLV
jgi:hypothetical protein